MKLTHALAALLLPAALILPAATATAAPRAANRKPTSVAKAAKKKPAAAPGPSGGALWAPPATPPATPPPPAEDKPADDIKPIGDDAAAAEAAPAKAPPAALKPAADSKAREAGGAPPQVASGPAPDLEKLRADYDRLRDDLFKSRARAQIVEDALYKSKLAATFRWKGAPGYVVHHASIRLDGGEIWDSGDKAVTDDLVTVAERGVKAGPHALTLRIEIRPGKKSADSDKLGYSSEHTFAIIVSDGQRTLVAITGDEDGDAPEYEPEVEVEVESKK